MWVLLIFVLFIKLVGVGVGGYFVLYVWVYICCLGVLVYIGVMVVVKDWFNGSCNLLVYL